MEQNEFQKAFDAIVDKAIKDEVFKANLMNSPAKILQEHGIVVSSGIGIRVVEEPVNTFQFVLSEFSDDELSEKELEDISGGNNVVIFQKNYQSTSSENGPIAWKVINQNSPSTPFLFEFNF
jgi:hypothetical protein